VRTEFVTNPRGPAEKLDVHILQNFDILLLGGRCHHEIGVIDVSKAMDLGLAATKSFFPKSVSLLLAENKKRMGERGLSCGIPMSTQNGSDMVPSILSVVLLSDKKDAVKRMSQSGMPLSTKT
jgi:hypothetical protein